MNAFDTNTISQTAGNIKFVLKISWHTGAAGIILFVPAVNGRVRLKTAVVR